MESVHELEASIPSTLMSPVQSEQIRRVGSFTMGITLISFGTLLLISLFQKWEYSTILTLTKLSPIILILLGCEILVYNIGFKYQKLKYDIVSLFICSGFIFGVIVLCSWVVFFENIPY